MPEYLTWGMFFSVFWGLALGFWWGFPEPSWFLIHPILLGIFVGTSWVLYGKAMQVGEASKLVLLFQLIPVITFVAAAITLKQFLTVPQLAALGIVVFGAIVASIEKTEGILKPTKGYLWMLMAITLWGCLNVYMDWALDYIDYKQYVVAEFLGMGLILIPLFLHPKWRKDILTGIPYNFKVKRFWMPLNSIFDTIGLVVLSMAFVLAPKAALVSLTMQVQTIYTFILGLLFAFVLKGYITETYTTRLFFQKLIGALIIFSGVALLLI